MLRKKAEALLSDNDDKKTFMEKWREHVARKKESGEFRDSSKHIIRALFMFQAPTQIYIFHSFLVPYIFDEHGPWMVYYFRVLCWFVMINTVANWLCVILYDPGVERSRDNPNLVRINQNRWENPPDQFIPLIQEASSHQNGSVVYDMTEKEALPWEYCDECKKHIPPRAHHCKVCKKCILKRDHHCFMVGNCIGFKNQRYFIMLAFYVLLNGSVGGYFTFKYLKEIYWPVSSSWTDFFPPITVWRFLFGTQIPHHICLMIVQLFLEILFGFIGFVYFTSQMAISAEGKTLYEVAKKVPIKNTNAVSRNLRSVFGDFWALNFLFPMTVIFRQRDDGIHWDGIKIFHSTNGKKWEDDGEIL